MQNGESFITSEKGNSMIPLIKSGQDHMLAPIESSEVVVGDIVYCKVKGRFYIHLVHAIDAKKGWLIGNNHGHMNGWTHSIYGKVINVIK